ncbi:MAG: NAD-dependent protein deacylase [Ruminococcaceae bacterium]|nr:NAD-dependent protein deacylase [Oscillospiraceae bacterium]
MTALREILSASKSLVFFTGAGISVPSGIPDFRSADGLYMQKEFEGATPEEIISHTYFYKHPGTFYRFYREKMLYPAARPNAAHRWIASLQTPERHVTVVTQNIDGFHSEAGSETVYELHGSAHRNLCPACGAAYSIEELLNHLDSEGIPRCPNDGKMMKPDVTLYEEPLKAPVIEGAIDAISHADTMVIIGTSLVVYPAASFVRYFRGEHLILINKTPTDYDGMAELALYEDVIDVVRTLKEPDFKSFLEVTV